MNIETTPRLFRFTIVPTLAQRAWFRTVAFLVCLVGIIQTVRAVTTARKLRREEQHRLELQARLTETLEEELHTARDMQRALMPDGSPSLTGLDIAGRSETANTVGGDYYQYFVTKSTVRLALGDVTGHAMEAAIPVVMFSGILETQIEHDPPLHQLFATLNGSMVRSRRGRTFIAFCMAEINTSTRMMEVANAACPYPYVYRASMEQFEEIEIDSYPLGIKLGLTFETRTVQLQDGDYVIFCSDGIIEAENESDEQFGFEATSDVLTELCSEGLPPDQLIDELFSRVAEYRGDTPQSDDMTCVVLKAVPTS